MRHRNQILLMVVLSLLLVPGASWGGQFMLGVKGWYANWDSAVLDWFEKDVGVGFAANGLTLNSDVGTGSGYLVGPLLSYQSDDGKYAVSFAAMVFSNFSQDWTGQAGSMHLSTDIDTRRMDFDLAASVALVDFKDTAEFFKFTKIFVGYKYQSIGYDLALTYDTYLMPGQVYNYKLSSGVHMPTIGLGVAYPFSDKLALSAQAGVGLALIDLDLEYPDGTNYNISPSASITYNGELNLSYMATKHLIVQMGLRAQVWYLTARSPQHWEETESQDLTYGVTASVVYAF